MKTNEQLNKFAEGQLQNSNISNLIETRISELGKKTGQKYSNLVDRVVDNLFKKH